MLWCFCPDGLDFPRGVVNRPSAHELKLHDKHARHHSTRAFDATVKNNVSKAKCDPVFFKDLTIPSASHPTESITMASAEPCPLFSPDLIAPHVSSALPPGYAMRPLQRGDYDNTFLDVLRVLTQVGDITRGEFEGRFDEMRTRGAGAGAYHVLVILNGEGKIVGTGALIVERKLYV